MSGNLRFNPGRTERASHSFDFEFDDGLGDETLSIPAGEFSKSNFRTQSASVVITGSDAATEEDAFFSAETAVEDRADDEADRPEEKS